MMMWFPQYAFLFCWILGMPAGAGTSMSFGCVNHPIDAMYRVQRVVDGDTVLMVVPELPAPLGNTLYLRILGIDAPEVHAPKCAEERRRGVQATEFLRDAVASVTHVRICGWDKYGMRILGDLLREGAGPPISEWMLTHGHAQPYSGAGPHPTWCGGGGPPSLETCGDVVDHAL